MLSGGAKGPGVFFIIPCLDVYEKIDMRTATYDVPPQEVKLIYDLVNKQLSKPNPNSNSMLRLDIIVTSNQPTDVQIVVQHDSLALAEIIY